MNTELRKDAKNNLEKYFFKMINNSVFRKTMTNVRKQKDIKPVKTETRRIYLMSEPNYDATNFFFKSIGIRNGKNKSAIL